MASILKIMAAMLLLSGVGRNAPRLQSASIAVPDQVITGNLERELRTNVQLRDAQIEVLTSNGVVRLEGTVTSLVAKQRAEQLVLAAAGVRRVDNRLRARGLSAAVRDIAVEIRLRFAADDLLADRELTVTSNQGIVSIAGTVDAPYLRSHAERIVRQIPGVLVIRNEVRVQGLPDETLRNIVLAELENDERFESMLVNVRVERQIVTLHGYVESPLQRELAETRAGSVPGVLDVDNRLVVANSPGLMYR